MKKTKLLIIALIIAASAGVLLPAYNIFTLQPAVYRLLIAATEQDTTRIARHIASFVFPEIEGVAQPDPEFGDLVREMFIIQQEFGLVKLKIFSLNGQVIFSTATEEINRFNRQDYFVNKVSKGSNFTRITTIAQNRTANDHNDAQVVQICVPIMRAGQFSGAVEIDYNITQRKAALDRLIHRSSVFLFLAGTGVLLASSFFGLRAKLASARQREAEKQLRAAHRRQQDIIEFLPDATFVIDRESRVVAWNRAMEEMTSVPKEAVLGKNNYEHAVAFYAERRPMLIDAVNGDVSAIGPFYDSLFRQGDTLFAESTLVLPHRDRQTNLWAIASPLLGQDGQYVGAIESIRDITDRRTAERRLSDKKVLLENILDNIPHFVFWKDRESTYLGCNRNFARVAGVENPDEIVGKTDFDLAWEREEAEFYRRCDRDVMLRGEPLLDIEESQLQADGKNAILLTSKVPLRNAQGDVVGVLGIFADITQQRELEMQLRHSQKLEAVGNLAGGIAHDFNNILTAIIGYTEFTVELLPDDAQGRFALNEALKAAARAKDLVRQILTFGQKMEQQQSPTRLEPVIREALNLLRAALPATIKICEEIDADVGEVMADPTQIHQVVMNLGTNACHAMQHKGGTLRVLLRQVHVDAALAVTSPDLHEGAYVCLSIEDTGHGMDAETLEHIFEPYFTTKGKDEGSGLGLSVVHGIIVAHGGAITVASTPGEGAAFTVYLPGLIEEDVPTAGEANPQGSEQISR